MLQSLHAEGWFDLYAFTLEPQYAVDFEVANHFTATHPSSPFAQHAFAQRTTPEASHLLFDRKLSVRRGDEVADRMIEDDDELLRVLAGPSACTSRPEPGSAPGLCSTRRLRAVRLLGWSGDPASMYPLREDRILMNRSQYLHPLTIRPRSRNTMSRGHRT